MMKNKLKTILLLISSFFLLQPRGIAQTVTKTGTFTDDRDGQIYKTITVGEHTWMAENLNYDVGGSKLWGNDPNNKKYGRMYKVGNAHKLVPPGWHIATDAEWKALIEATGGDLETAGKFLKSKTGWQNKGDGLDLIGFNAQPGGVNYTGTDRNPGESSSWWAAENRNEPVSIRWSMEYDSDVVYRHEKRAIWFAYIRCVKDYPIEEPKFKPTVESLKQYTCPEWFRDAKFGIYLCWGIYSVPEMDGWYARYMYWEGTDAYRHHLKTYGHPSEFGYKDLIPLWKAENFDPDALVSLFKEAGAKYFTPLAVFHDNFDLWASKYHKWNAVNMGPKKDLIGMWKAAADKQGLRWGVTTHLARNYHWMNTANGSDVSGSKKGIPYDAAQGKGKGFYPPNDGQDPNGYGVKTVKKEWSESWLKRLTQLIDDYDPDHMYFDGAIPFGGDDKGQTGMKLMAYYYNTRPEGFLCIKKNRLGVFEEGVSSVDYERGKADEIASEPWQTDDSIGPWGYVKGATYMTPDLVVDKIVDIVSKNGNMLLNVPIRADGTLDDETISILTHVGRWFKINGEAIYGTRPWYTYGEGENRIGSRDKISNMTSSDIRFVTKNELLYAFVLGWPKKNQQVVIKKLGSSNPKVGEIERIELLGYDGKLDWEQSAGALYINFPKKHVGDYAYALKVVRKTK